MRDDPLARLASLAMRLYKETGSNPFHGGWAFVVSPDVASMMLRKLFGIRVVIRADLPQGQSLLMREADLGL